MNARQAIGLFNGLVLVCALLAGCTDERIVFRERDRLEGVPAAAAGYLGYQDSTAKMTVCGDCHIGPQTRWENTAHAHAWETLDDSGHRQATCEGCHTVNEMGNPDETANAGYTATKVARYLDVQCESCHGPGRTHVENPGDTNIPLASIAATVDANGGCGECHTGFHHPFVEEWAQSGHGQVLAYPAGKSECQGCHTGQGALLAFNVRSDYIEKGSATHQPITCAVCHDPHNAEFAGQLRYSIDVPDEEQNLCMRCHHKRGEPDPTGPQRGAHSPEGPLLLGEAGWWPPNMPIEPGTRILGTHGSDANPRLCAGCHVQAFQARDEATGQLTVSTAGHLFEAIPCVDSQGQPIPGDCGLTERTFRTCTASGCHGSQDAARSALTLVRARIAALAGQLDSQLDRVPAAEFDPDDNRYSTAEGARFNWSLADKNGSEVHNPFLLEALLIGSIAQVQEDYGIAPSGTVSLKQQLRPPPMLR
ncbi:MAG TPA: multiheme c-type cytochrome [Longimicrobiales bacterium]|nr:multiheme c-type cytochrome [Longimicrobiales bacterium]